MSFRNDNLIVKTKDEKIKYQISCYLLFAVYVVGETSITTGLIRRARKYQFVICLCTSTFRTYSVIGNRMEGNTLLHRKQYMYDSSDIPRFLVSNKIRNQEKALSNIRQKSEACTDAIKILKQYEQKMQAETLSGTSLLGLEGSASRVYFPQMFSNMTWQGRRPRTKCDYVNTTLDIGYTMLFNMVDSLLQLYGFDVYCGVYHKEYYMRKSLACDLMEPMRPIIDYKIRKAINLQQCKQSDFELYNNQWQLSHEKAPQYIGFLMEEVLEHKEEMFLFVQAYYRAFMKQKDIKEYRAFEL